MKRRAFFAGSLAAPVALSISDVFAALINQAEPIPQDAHGPSAVKMPPIARLYIDGHEIDRILSISANQYRDVIEVTSDGYFADSSSGVRMLDRGIDYSIFEVSCQASQQTMSSVSKLYASGCMAEFVADLGDCSCAFTGIVEETQVSIDSDELIVLSFTFRATSPVVTSAAD